MEQDGVHVHVLHQILDNKLCSGRYMYIYILYMTYVHGIIQKGNILDMTKYDKFENLFIHVFFYSRGINPIIIFNHISN